jgi:hypothetical protein
MSRHARCLAGSLAEEGLEDARALLERNTLPVVLYYELQLAVVGNRGYHCDRRVWGRVFDRVLDQICDYPLHCTGVSADERLG